jgi:hypothetical protein
MGSTASENDLQLLEVRIVATVSARPGLSALQIAQILGVGGLSELLVRLVTDERVFRSGIGQDATYYPEEDQAPPPSSQRRQTELVVPGVQRVVRRRRIVTT